MNFDLYVKQTQSHHCYEFAFELRKVELREPGGFREGKGLEKGRVWRRGEFGEGKSLEKGRVWRRGEFGVWVLKGKGEGFREVVKGNGRVCRRG